MNVQSAPLPAEASEAFDPSKTKIVDQLTGLASVIGSEIVEIAGFLDEIDGKSQSQLKTLQALTTAAADVTEANAHVREAITGMREKSDSTISFVDLSVKQMRNAAERTKQFAAWVQDLENRMLSVEDNLKEVKKSNTQIANIAKQVNILAVNAKIEAARAGEMGLGFAVVAEAINELSQKTGHAASSISGSVDTLGELVTHLRAEAQTVSSDAEKVINDSVATDNALTDIAQNVSESATAAQEMEKEASKVSKSVNSFAPAIAEITGAAGKTAEGIVTTRKRVHDLIDYSEGIVQGTVRLGGSSDDQHYIEHVIKMAAEVSGLFQAGVAEGEISESALFDRTYSPIAGTSPQQVMAPFTDFTDAVLPAVQEAALEFDARVVFCAAVDTNGYLPTHNLKFSKPQSEDPDWNAGNCRNRRIFDDRVGLKAGRNQEPFLLQVYRRDMGGGVFSMMKDLSAPIFVNGRHWGGLRFAYQF